MRKASIEDITAIFLAGGLAMLTVLALSLTVSSDQSSRDEQRAEDIREHRTMFDTRTVLQAEVEDGYRLDAYLADAATTGRLQPAIQVLEDTLNNTKGEWYWSYAGREGTIPDGKDAPDMQADPLKLPTKTGTVTVLLYRYDES